MAKQQDFYNLNESSFMKKKIVSEDNKKEILRSKSCAFDCVLTSKDIIQK